MAPARGGRCYCSALGPGQCRGVDYRTGIIHRCAGLCGVFGVVATWSCRRCLEAAPAGGGLGCVWWVEQTYVAERSISPSTGAERWVVADARTFDLHVEACAFLAGVRSKGRSPNTERVYAGRLALYLN